ncbi:MAG: quinone oxidoreductase [Isosphaeraceae bacterium]|jgi:NADPH2:quinone reductase|nr:MAG: quinone oxidoreductase [Isosphaeraceae bacterium]
MRAAYIEATGGPEVIRIGELPDRRPGVGEVAVRVGAAAVNPIDLYIRAGTVAMPLSYPFIVGCDLAGTVEEVGPGVTRFQAGDRVWGSNQGLLGRQGVTCTRAVVGEEWLYPTPANLNDVQAAAMALVGITAHLGLFDRGRLESGETVYVSGGSGGVGTMVIQMARAAGARVITTASTAEKAELCRKLGADAVINYRTEDLEERLRALAPEGVDLWFETQREPNLERMVSLMRKNGRMILMAGRAARPVLPAGPFYTRNLSLLGFAMFQFAPETQRRCAEAMNQWAAQGQLKPVVGKVFPLEQTAEAHRFLEASTLGGAGQVVGKVVVAIE